MCAPGAGATRGGRRAHEPNVFGGNRVVMLVPAAREATTIPGPKPAKLVNGSRAQKLRATGAVQAALPSGGSFLRRLLFRRRSSHQASAGNTTKEPGITITAR